MIRFPVSSRITVIYGTNSGDVATAIMDTPEDESGEGGAESTDRLGSSEGRGLTAAVWLSLLNPPEGEGGGYKA